MTGGKGEGARRRLLLVVGIGRSGTSLLTGIVGRLGFHVPQPEVQADDTNPRGFGEPRWVVDFHTRLMRARRITVFDSRPVAWRDAADAVDDDAVLEELRSWLAVQLVGADDVVVKDPRIGWFLPLWRRCAEDLGIQTSFATMLRRPTEVVASARTWYGTWQNDASRAAAWLNVTLHTEQTTRQAPRAFVLYEDLLSDWASEVARVGELLSLSALAEVNSADRPDVGALVDPRLRRSAPGWGDMEIPHGLRSILDAVWSDLRRLAEPGGDDGATHATLDEALAVYGRLYAEAEAIAQSSVTAAKPRRRPGPPAPERKSPVRRAPASLPLQIIRRIPRRYRRRVPLPVRQVAVRAGSRVASALRR